MCGKYGGLLSLDSMSLSSGVLPVPVPPRAEWVAGGSAIWSVRNSPTAATLGDKMWVPVGGGAPMKFGFINRRIERCSTAPVGGVSKHHRLFFARPFFRVLLFSRKGF